MGKRSSKYCRTSGRGQGTTAGKKFCRNPHYCRKLNSKYCKSSGRGRYSSYCKINRKKASTQAKKCKWLRRVCVALSWRCRILRCRRRGKRSMKTIRRQAASNRRMKKRIRRRKKEGRLKKERRRKKRRLQRLKKKRTRRLQRLIKKK